MPSILYVSPAQVAKTFSEVLRDWLTPEQWAEMRRLNAKSNPGVCHSGDYCDSNMAMDEALRRHKVQIWREEDANGDPTEAAQDHPEGAMRPEVCALWNEAWEIAKRDYLSAPKITV